jgi:ribonuclease Z
MLRDDIGYRLAHHEDLTWDPSCEVVELLDGVLEDPQLHDAGLTVTAFPTDHRPVGPTVGYRFDHEGAAVVCAGDTVPCAGLERLLVGADVYVQTVVRPDLITPLGVPRLQDVCDYHSSVEQAARTAAAAGVRVLVLTHMVPAPAAGSEAEWVELAARHFDGDILLASDLDTVEV